MTIVSLIQLHQLPQHNTEQTVTIKHILVLPITVTEEIPITSHILLHQHLQHMTIIETTIMPNILVLQFQQHTTEDTISPDLITPLQPPQSITQQRLPFTYHQPR